MVKHFGYCPSLRKKVDFEVSEVVDIPTKRGIKYQIKGNYEGRLCNTFCSASKAQELRTQIGSPKVFTVMDAEESQENLAQATQEESVPPIIGPSEKAYGQEGEAAQELPLAQTMPTPIISADDMSVQPIDDLSLPDATLADMQETLDVPPTMDADFEIAEIQPEGDGSSIGNIAPMNPDAPLHAEDFDAEESQENLGQATQEESVPSIIGPSQEAYGQEGEAAQELPLAETVPTPIISAVDMNVEPIDSLSSFNGGDILSQMESNLGERPEIMADFAIRPYQLFGQGRSIGNIAPMNPDVPFASEDDDDDDYADSEEARERRAFEERARFDPVGFREMYGVSPYWGDDDDFDAETLSSQEIEEMAQVPPPVCFAEKIPPSVWENTTIQDQLDYASSKNEGLLDCPQCGISKAELRNQGGYCGTTDPESEEYISSRSCPYEKYFAPQHWIDEPQVISHITPERIVLEDTLMAEMDMPATDPIMAGVETRFIPKGLFYQINSMLPDGVVANQTIDGMGYELSYYGMDTEALDKIIDSQSQGYDIMFGANDADMMRSESKLPCCPKPSYFQSLRGVMCRNCGKDNRMYRPAKDDLLFDKMRAETFDDLMEKGINGMTLDDWLDEIDRIKATKEPFYYSNNILGSPKYGNMIDMFWEQGWTPQGILDAWESYDRQEGHWEKIRAETFDAESKKKPSKTAEKAILTGASTGATMEIADALLAAEGERSFTLNYGPKRMYVVIEYNDGKELFIQDYKQFVEELNEAEATGDEELIESLFGVGSDYHNIAEEGFDMGGPNSTPHEAETFEAEGWTEKIGAGRKAYCGTCERLIQQSTRIYVNDSNGDIECADCYEYQQEAETFNAEETIFTQWVMDNYPHSYFSLIRERDRRNKDMDFAQWLMDTYPHIYFSYVEERMARDIGFEAETFEDCEVCYATVDKGTLNDVQAGRICNECHKMNQYEGGTKTIKTPYNAETFEANDAESFGAETIKTGVICGDNGCSGELLETEYGKASKVHCNKCDYSEIMEWDAETFEAGNGLGKNQRNLMQIIIQDYQRHSNQYAIVRVKTSKYCGGYTPQMIDSLYRKNMIKYLDNKGNPDIGFKEISLNPYQLSDCPTILVKPTNRALQMNAKDFDAETFGVEFDDWADQEMKSHGENVSFKKWAKEEGEKHGDVPLTDWAEHEEESHDERYGADYTGSEDNEMFYQLEAKINMEDGWEHIADFSHKEEAIKSYQELKNKHPEVRLLEVLGYSELEYDDENNDFKNAESFDAEEYEILISDNNMDFGDSYNSFNDEQEALEEAWKLSQKETDMFVYVRRNDGKVIRVFRPNLGRGAENFESQSAQTKVKPPIKSIGILLGLGAIAAVVAPENLKKMFKR